MQIGWVALVLSVMYTSVRCHGVNAIPTEESPKWSEWLQAFRSRLPELAKEVHGYVVSIVGTRAVETSFECVQGVIRVLSEGAASGLNVTAVYVSEVLRAAGLSVKLPFHRITPEGVAFVAQWALLALIGYWVLSLVFRLVGSVLRQALWLLKLGVALWLFALIVSDTNASTDTTALRLAGLVCACVLLGLGRTGTEGDRTKYLENRVRSLEGKLKEMERKRKEE